MLLGRWVSWVARHARMVAASTCVLTIISAVYFIDNLAINTNTSDMLSRELSFRQKSTEIDKAFPQTDSTLVVVIDGQTADIADDAALILAGAMRRAPALYRDVYDLEGEPFIRRNGLLYLGLDELYELSDRLTDAQPFLGALWSDPTLRGFFRMLGLAIDKAAEFPDDPPLNLEGTLNAIAEVAEAQSAGRFHLLSWTKLMGGEDSSPADRRRYIVVQPTMDHASLQPASKAIDGVRALARELGLTPERGIRVRLTGSVALDEEELESVERGMGLAAILSLILVLGLLFVGLRQTKLVISCLATLIAGLVWTAGFAIWVIGTLNLLSVAFAVLFIGLSVDFGLHFALRYREELWCGYSRHEALVEAAKGGGGALTLCAISAAMAFYAFIPTDYVGLAELGLIAGTGMFVALFANLTVLPALIALWPLAAVNREARPHLSIGGFEPSTWIGRKPRWICFGALILSIAAAGLVPRVTFDFDPLNLKDPSTESMSTLYDLLADGSRNYHTIEVLASDLTAADDLAQRLRELRAVGRVMTLSSYVPKNQDDKLLVIQDMAFLIAPALGAREEQPRISEEDRLTTWSVLSLKLEHMAKVVAGPSGEAATRVRDAIMKLKERSSKHASLREFEHRLLRGLPGRLDSLSQALQAEPVSLEALPRALWERKVSADGRALIEVSPESMLHDRMSLRAFVEAVQSISADAVGSPVVILEAGRAVLGAFFEACVFAMIGIVVLLSIVLRRGRDVALVFAPLMLAGLWTLAATTFLNQSFNFANLIVLPLLFGLGVAGGIHIVARFRAETQASDALLTSTPRAVLFSALTTIGSFGSIALSGHPGTASMGVLLTLALVMILLATLIFLPALLTLLYPDE